VARKIAVVVACVAAAGALFALGRASVDRDEAGDAGERSARAAGLREGLLAGHASGVHQGRAAGIREGRAAGVEEGRLLQLGESLPRDVRRIARRAFEAGYAAGANDVFGGFDGGWSLTKPYVITLRRGSGAITYRIDSRRPTRGTRAP
jgi:hypothetical protein